MRIAKKTTHQSSRPTPVPVPAVSIIPQSLSGNLLLLRKIWLVFAQACTVCLAALFVVSTLRPDLLPPSVSRGGVWRPTGLLGA